MEINQPLFTFVIPAYNAENHLHTSLPSLLNTTCQAQGIFKYFEVIVVNDGSTDNTLNVIKEYAHKWNAVHPNLVSYIDKPNGQYGSTINASLKVAKGKYYKVLDADDWFEVKHLIEIVLYVKSLEDSVDVIFTDHVYERVELNKRIVNSLWTNFESNKVMNLRDVKFPTDLITMHSIIYRTQLLKDIDYQQMEKYYYTDSQFALIPLIAADTMLYIKMPLYHYYIGRADQSVNLRVMSKNRSHQLLVVYKLLEIINLEEIRYKSVKRYVYYALRRLIQWQMLIIVMDDRVPRKYVEIKKMVKNIQAIQKANNNKFLSGAFFKLVKFTRGVGIKHFIRWGLKLYSRYKINFMNEW